VDAVADVELSWTPGEWPSDVNGEAVYLGTSWAVVKDANASDTTGIYRGRHDSNSYDPNGLELDLYYWRVDQVNEASDPNSFKGHIWSFVARHTVVDDFESYVDNMALRAVWDDYGVGGTGAAIMLETDVNFVRDGTKSLLYQYDSAYKDSGECIGSEADTDTSQLGISSDWTSGGIKSLVLYFLGDPCNSATADDQLWLQLEDANSNAGVAIYDGDPNDVKEENWHEWNIDLATFDACGVSLGNVDKIYIGFGGAEAGGDCNVGGTGTVYIDDIRLYPPACVPEFTLASLNDDCITDYNDLSIMAEQWLTIGPEADIVKDSIVNFEDYGLLADNWLEELLVP
jgi:hypothetical protein